MNVHVTAQSQSHRLRERVSEAKIAHGDEVRADLQNVRVAVAAGAVGRRFWLAKVQPDLVGEVYFCNMGPIRLRERIAAGDGQELPTEVELEGLEISGAGNYDLLNALVRSNGKLEIVVDEQTQVLPAQFV